MTTKMKQIFNYLLIALFVLLATNVLAQKKNRYVYLFYPPNIKSYYFYSQIESSDEECVQLNKNNEVLLSISYLKIDGSQVYDHFASFVVITGGTKDTMRFYLEDSTDTKIKIPKQPFHFVLVSMFTLNLDSYSIPIENEQINKISLIIVRRERQTQSYKITSKKELTTEEVLKIGNDIIYGTKTSKLVEGKDYWVGAQL